MRFIYDVYKCKQCGALFETPEGKKEGKIACTFCGSLELQKIFGADKTRPSSFS
jgi:DNA-directed RNA polymerase subunit RPC12/RpoP